MVTLLHVEAAVPFGRLSDAVIIGWFEVKADEAQQQWMPQSPLLVAGAEGAQADGLCRQFTARRASHRVRVTQPAEQISYIQKFLSLRQAQPRSGPGRPGSYRLRTREHNEFLAWIAQYRPSELLFLFNLSRR